MSVAKEIGKERRPALLAITAAMVFWGFSYISTKSLLRVMTPFQIAAGRYLLTVVILLAIGLGAKKFRPAPFREWPRLFLAAFSGIFVYFVLENSGLRLTTAGMGSLIIATIPVINILVAAVFFRQRPAPSAWVGVLLSVGGVFLVIHGGAVFSFASLWGNLLVLGAAFSWVGYTLLNQPLSHKYDAFSLSAYQAMVGAPLLTLLAWGEGKPLPALSPAIMFNLLFLAFCCSTLGYIFYNYALRRLGPTVVTTFVNFIPVFGVIGGVAILGEPFGASQIAGGIVILAGVSLVSRKTFNIAARNSAKSIAGSGDTLKQAETPSPGK